MARTGRSHSNRCGARGAAVPAVMGSQRGALIGGLLASALHWDTPQARPSGPLERSR